jgi:WhiB family redox-sensing transcriptional regulator
LTVVPDAPVAFEPEPLPPATPDQWQDRALCAQTDPEAFFPEKGGSTREAKKICLGCEVRHECLDYALAHDERFGIWGGLSERERRRLKRGII